MNKKELKRLLEEEYAWGNIYTESNKWFIDELLGDFLDILKKQLTLTDVVKRYDVNKYTPPFRVGRKQGKAVLDSKGLEVVFFMHSEEQAKMYCDYLNNV